MDTSLPPKCIFMTPSASAQSAHYTFSCIHAVCFALLEGPRKPVGVGLLGTRGAQLLASLWMFPPSSDPQQFSFRVCNAQYYRSILPTLRSEWFARSLFESDLPAVPKGLICLGVCCYRGLGCVYVVVL